MKFLNSTIYAFIFLACLLVSFNYAEAGTKYWYGGTGNWSDAASHWSENSGNSPSAATSTPTANDNVVFDSASNADAYTVTIDTSATSSDLTIGNPASGVITLDGSNTLTISGSATFANGMTNNYTGAITFNSTATGKTITSNGVALASALAFNGAGGGWTLQDALSATATTTLTNGTLDTNSQSVSSPAFTTAVGVKTLNLGSTTWTLTGNATTIWSNVTASTTMVGNAATIVANYSGSTGTRTITMGLDVGNPSLSITAGTDIIVTPAAILKNLNFTGFAGIWSSISGALTLYGNLTLASGMANSNSAALTFAAASAKLISQDTAPYNITFSADGTKMYIAGTTNDSVYQYTLGTAWDVSTASSTLSKSVTTQDIAPTGVAFSADGTKMYIMGNNNDTVFQYTLGTAWDVSTASYASISTSTTAQESSPFAVTFNPAGTKMYIVGSNNDKVYQYTLSSAWNVSTASLATSSPTVTAQDTSPYALAFNSDGTKMYIAGTTNDSVYQYTLGTAWDVSTAAASSSKSVSAQDTNPVGLAFNSDGTKMYIVGNTTSPISPAVYQYTLGTAWDITTAVFTYNSKTITSNGKALPSALNFNGVGGSWTLADALVATSSVTLTNGILDTNSQSVSSVTFTTATGVKVLNLGSTTWTLTGNNATIWSWTNTTATILGLDATIAANYSGGTGSRIINMGSDVANPSFSITAGTDVISFGQSYLKNLNFTGFAGTWQPNSGLILYGNLTLASGMTNNNTATLTFAATSGKSVTAQDSSPYKAVFNSDGTKMYTLGFSTDTVYQYNLGNAWEASSSAYTSFSVYVNAMEPNPRGLAFSADGTKMYIVGTTNDRVYQYTLGTAWDIFTAAYASTSKSIVAQEANSYAVAFSSDGAKMYIVGTTNSTVYQYTLGTAWDVSTASYASISTSTAAQEPTPYGLTFNSDGTKMYITGDTYDTVYQYTLGTEWNVSTAVYNSVSKSVMAQDTGAYGLTFNSDGTKMYITGATNDMVYQYALGTAWDVSTADISAMNSKTITSNGKTIASPLIFNGWGGSWRLADALTMTGLVLTLTNGVFNPNGQTVSMTGAGTAAVTGPFSFYNFTRTGTAVTTDELTFSASTTIANMLTLTGNSSINKILVRSSSSGVRRAIAAGAVSLSDVRFRDIDADGPAISWAGTRLIDAGNNLDINFYSIVARYWVNGTGDWSDAAGHWSDSSGGTAGAGNLPTADDHVVFDSASNATAYEVTINSAAVCNDLTIGNPASGAITLAGSSTLAIYGSASLAAGMTNNYTGAITFKSTSFSAKTITTNGVALASWLTFNGIGGNWQLADALFTTATTTLTNGTLDTNSQSVSSVAFATAAGTKILNFGSTTWTLTGKNVTIWNWSTTNATMIGILGTITANYSGATGTRTIIMGNDNSNPSLSITAGADIINTNAAYLNNLDFTGFAGTWSSASGALTIYGNLTLSPGMANGYTAALILAATAGKVVTAQDPMPYNVVFNSDGTKMYMVGNQNDSIYQYTLGTAWDISTAAYASLSKSVNAQDISPYGLTFSPDGTKMYVIGAANDKVYQYTLSPAWDVSTASYASSSPSVTAQDANPSKVVFNPDGTNMYIMGNINDKVYQYTLNPAWDVSTAFYASSSPSVTAQDSSPYGLTFNPDGTKMYIAGDTNNTVYQYVLSTAWDVSTASYASRLQSVSTQDASPYGVTFNSDGTKMYIAGSNNATVYQYTLSTAWDISSAVLITNAKTITSNGKALASTLNFNGIGGSWTLADALSTTGAVTLITGTFNTNSQSVSSPTFTYGNGAKVLDLGSTTWTLTGNNTTIWNWTSSASYIILGTRATIVSNYSGSTGTRTIAMSTNIANPSLSITAGTDTVNISGATYLNSLNFTGFSGIFSNLSGALTLYGNLTLASGMTNSYTGALTFAATSGGSVTTQESTPYGVTFNSDGTKMYVVGTANDTVYQYTLSTAWDASTAVYTSFFTSVTATDGSPFKVIFKPDGTKMYIMGNSSDTVYQYNLGTAWEVVTAANASSSFSVTAQEPTPYGLAFNPDGTKMYIAGTTNDSVYQYTLGTAWDVSTASSTLSKSVTTQDISPTGVAFSADGTKMYIMGNNNDTVYQYTLGTAWDVSTASYASISTSTTAQESSPFAVTFNPAGTKMYIVGSNNDTVYQYALGTAWDVSTANLIITNAKTITSNNKALASPITFDGKGGYWTLADNLTTGAANTVYLTNGTFDTGNKDFATGLFSSTNSNLRTIKGTGTWNLTGVATVWNTGTKTNLAINDTVTIKLTDNSANTKNFAGGGITCYNFWNATGGTGTVTITGSNTFNNFKIDAGRTQIFTAGTTQTVNSFNANGTSTSPIILASTAASPFFLIKSGLSRVSTDYISVSYSTVTPANIWYAGTHSTNGGNNPGWIFTDPYNQNTIRGDFKVRGDFKLK